MANKKLLEHVNWSQAICTIGGPRWRGERKSSGQSQQPPTLDLLGGGSKVGHMNKNRVRARGLETHGNLRAASRSAKTVSLSR